ncbi:hypothetical protein MUK42_28798 [Musa troglodytarum]|uniref:Uncharacterized protein n=1 Tax=Musa troglodytarum TaxID=320322 RepID=A0A9E7KB01_9LILI|nr:hypothetical protein MUK42_28798 [Musa troglodytarum]
MDFRDPWPRAMEANGAPPAAENRRAHSETFLRLPDDILFETDSDIDFPSLSDDNVSGGDAGAVGGALSAEPGMSD